MLSLTEAFFILKAFKHHSLNLLYLKWMTKVLLCSAGAGWGPSSLIDIHITLQSKSKLLSSSEINATELQRTWGSNHTRALNLFSLLMDLGRGLIIWCRHTWKRYIAGKGEVLNFCWKEHRKIKGLKDEAREISPWNQMTFPSIDSDQTSDHVTRKGDGVVSLVSSHLTLGIEMRHLIEKQLSSALCQWGHRSASREQLTLEVAWAIF